eukprot:610699-Amphidinium_carterae.1
MGITPIITLMKARQTQAAVDQGKVTVSDLFGNSQAHALANLSTDELDPLEPTVTWKLWTDFAHEVFYFWKLVGPRLREQPDNATRLQLPPKVPEEPPDAGIV